MNDIINPDPIERRYFTGEVRMIDPDTPKISGYAARFNELSEDLGGFREVIRPGFFDGVLADDVRALFNHDQNLVLGRTTAGTLALDLDDQGLLYQIIPPDTQAGRDTVVSIGRGDVDQSSFGFTVAEDNWLPADDQRPYILRELVRAGQLFDVSPVTYPAYSTTSVAVRQKLLKMTQPQAGPGDITALDGDVGRLALRRRKFNHALRYGGKLS